MDFMVLNKMKILFRAHQKKADLLKVMETMLTARQLDLALFELWKIGKISRSLFSGIGEEAGPAVITSLMSKNDRLIPHHRGFVYEIGKGISLDKMVAEIMGKASGLNRGNGGLAKFTDLELNIYACTDMLGSIFPISLGMAFAIKKKKEKNIVVVFFGDGSTTRAPFYSALNLAAIWKVPLFFVCINNQYSISARFSDTSITTLEDKVRAFGVSYEKVDGNDPLAIYSVAEKTINFVRENNFPAFLELNTFRIHGHNQFDRAHYQDETEVNAWKVRDPLKIFSQTLIAYKLATKQELKKMVDDIKAKIQSVIQKADQEPLCNEEDLIKDIFENPCRK